MKRLKCRRCGRELGNYNRPKDDEGRIVKNGLCVTCDYVLKIKRMDKEQDKLEGRSKELHIHGLQYGVW